MNRSNLLRTVLAAAGHSRAPRSRLAAFQDDAVTRLVHHAARRVPYYRRRFTRAGICADAITSVADLAQLPVITKDEIRSVPPSDLLDETRDPATLVSISTTGSTGRPFRIVNSWLEYRQLHLFRLRAHRQFGRRLGDRFAEIDQPIARHPNDRKMIGDILRALGLEARIQLSLYDPPAPLLERFLRDVSTAHALYIGMRERPEHFAYFNLAYSEVQAKIKSPAWSSLA